MLYYNRISGSEGIDSNYTGLDTSKECNVCHLYSFKAETFYISLFFAMDSMMLYSVLNCFQILKLFQLNPKPIEFLAICSMMKVIICLNQVV